MKWKKCLVYCVSLGGKSAEGPLTGIQGVCLQWAEEQVQSLQASTVPEFRL